MNVHIVCQNTGDHVLARMADALVTETGWSLSTKPERRVDINLFLPYLIYRSCPHTRTGAYFTHREVNDRNKARTWDNVEGWVDLRLYTARQYVNPARPSAVVRPPVDRDKFRPPSAWRKFGMGRVGVSGMTYKTGRKGEQLVTALDECRRSGQIDIELVASGRGWGVPTERYAWELMHEFYWSLDVLICTSIVEGVPMPPLEAMACGVPVLIPRGVGMLDDIPEHPAVYRYETGNFVSMVEALTMALRIRKCGRDARRLVADELRSLTAPYTAANWAADIRGALEGVPV